METDQRKVLLKNADLLLRWDKLIIFSVLLSLFLGLVVYLNTPKTYQSSSLIMYEQQKISPSRLSPDQEKKIGQMVNTVTQQVASRTSLEGIIKEFGLYQDQLAKLPLEDVVDMMRSKIDISAQQKKGDIFSVSFQDGNPRKAMLVTNAIAAKFIEENLRFREERASETTAYIDDELRMAKETLDKKEDIMRDYKLKYYNEMPSQRAINISRLNTLQEQYQAVQANIQNLEQTRLLVQQQYELQMQSMTNPASGSSKNAQIFDLDSARLSLKSLLSKYTPEHPAVKQLEKQIQQLEQERKGSGAQSDKQTLQLEEIKLNLKSLRENSRKIQEQIGTYQRWIESTPVREAEWAAVTRDYEELKKHYEYLVSQSLAAQSAESLERRQKGSQFRIVDPAYLPEKPLKPNFLKIMFVAVVLGLGGGVGGVVLFNFFDNSFKDVSEIEELLQMSVICSIPLIVMETEKRKNKIISICYYSSFGFGFLCLVVAMVYLFQKGRIVL
ncbi:MAG: hypothetical protein OEM02_03260 [Desulfobulbaceae bacterium]|nr:hypothetical protein [Desulfobulbaceae bacterium]